jgi:CRISPR-associated protein Csd1
MNWIEALYRTYENNVDHVGDPNDDVPLLPLFHSTQNAQVHVVLDGEGNFLRAEVISKENAQTIIPATEASAGRSGSKIAPHPLCDTLQYVAGDYRSWGGNPRKKKDESGYAVYLDALQNWAEWSSNPKLHSVLEYLRKACLIKDLVTHKVLFGDDSGRLLETWTESHESPPIFKAIKLANKKGQYEAFVRFSVGIPGVETSELWLDTEIRESWITYYSMRQDSRDICMVLGKPANIARNHPRNIRYPGDGAKLITSNDTEWFTYLGKFTNAEESCSVGMEVTQKSHNALRWLIDRQGRRDGDQVFVAWAVSGVDIPDLFLDSLSLALGKDPAPSLSEEGYTAQEIGIALSRKIAGYAADLKINDRIVVLGLDSALENGKGRLAMTFYRELTGSELLRRVERWHTECSWRQYFGKNRIFIGAPAPRDIAETAYGRKLDDKLRKATVERLLPCIVDGAPIPNDLVESCVRRASNRNGIEFWEWEKALGIACALYRYQQNGRNYIMALDRERRTRDYLYGRLLALAERLEERALYVGGERRETNAGKLMQRFAERPYSTWVIIETSLTPFKVRLRTRRPGFLHAIETELHEVHALFDFDDYTSDRRLTGEFLLGYHCQRAARDDPDEVAEDQEESEQEQTGTL